MAKADSREKRPLAIITGGSSGIGLACARLLGARGFRLVLVARDRDRLLAARDGLAAAGFDVATRAFDVSDEAAAGAGFSEIIDTHGTPSWMIASAGIVEPGLFLDQGVNAHRRQMETNYFGTLNAVRAVAPAMVAAGEGRVVLVSSGAGLFGVVGYASYGASKFAVRGLAEVLRIELAVHGISVTVAFPPDTDTPQLAGEAATRPAATAVFSSGRPLGADVVARAILAGAERGRFAVTPGWTLTAVARLQGLLQPILSSKQLRILQKHPK